MTLKPGIQLGTYEIVSLIGTGGMGEVYQARDSKLERDVAIKLLPEAFANDPQRLARFQREARILAALNHPGIAAIYGLEEDGGRHYLVMELVPGETLLERITREEPIAIEEALEISRQIAEALENAHERGIIHRDLKPANVKITPEGKVKVLDFGLAKAFAEEASSSGASESPTLSAMATVQGMILGTAAYMSPEQARAKTVDKRTDLWAFGCVLYELLTGKRAFGGEGVTDILAAVLKTEPDWKALPPATSGKVRDLLQRCLQKDRRRRLQDAGDARIEIEEALSAPSVEDLAAAGSRLSWKTAALLLLALIFGAAIAGAALWSLRSPGPAKVVRFSYVLPENQLFTSTNRQMVAVSPDGSSLVYESNDQFYLRRLSETESHPIAEKEAGVNTPCFSPDGQWIAFWSFQDGALKKIAVTGGAAITLCKTSNPYGISWKGDTIVFDQGSQGIFAVSANGGTPEVWAKLDPGEVAHSPDILPGGKAVLFAVLKSTSADGGASSANAWDKADIYVYSRKTGKRTRLLQGGNSPRYLLTGHLIYALGNNLLMVSVDLKHFKVTGSSVPIRRGIMRSGSTGVAQFAVSPDGTLVSIPESSSIPPNTGGRIIALADRSGKRDMLGLPPGSYRHPRVSPDGRRLAVETLDEGGTIWIHNLRGSSAPKQLMFEGSTSYPVWSPDGGQLAFLSSRDDTPGIFLQAAEGVGAAERLTTLPAADSFRPNSWSADGKNLAFMAVKGSDWGIGTIELTGERKAEMFMDVPASNQTDLTFSPDGNWVAYVSNESGNAQVYVQPFPKTGSARYRISQEGRSTAPVWSRDGKALYYYETDSRRLMAVAIQAQGALHFGQPAPIAIEGMIQSWGDSPDYDVMPDGERFLVILPEALFKQQSFPVQQMDIVLNWFEELKQQMPAD